jgi:peptide/nickel transport system substrate-binding protein
VQSLANSPEADLLSLLGGYLEQVGVKMEIQQLEYGAYFSAMVTRTNTAGYFITQSPTNPTTSLRKQFVKGQQWNVSQYDDPEFDKKIAALFLDKNEGNRMRALRGLTREVLDKAPYIWLPSQYLYTAWWPWVQNYGGEVRVGAGRGGPIHARVWVDQEMKKKMGF